MYDETEGVIPGNALVVDAKKRFRPLSKFGNAFLNRFQCSNTTSDVLKVYICVELMLAETIFEHQQFFIPTFTCLL